jgi:hypothetical protein
MKILAMVAAIAWVAGTASARKVEKVEIPAGPAIPVCVERAPSMSELIKAEGFASKMFAAAGVTIEWRTLNVCPADGIRISISRGESHAYGYALPYQGTHIVLFWDWIADATTPRVFPYFLAHLLVHEITHILQGVARHSYIGVMKAGFTRKKIGQMEFFSMPFTAEDLALIQSGLEARQTRTAQIADQAAVASSGETPVGQQDRPQSRPQGR